MTRHEQLRRHLEFFNELGVDGLRRDPEWRQRRAIPPSGRTTGPIRTTGQKTGEAVVSPDPLSLIREDIGDCRRCKLHTGRMKLVFGVGDPTAELMFVGEAPGRDEDREGVPFVGPAGQLLTKIIAAIGFSRDEVYIANVIKCRPPRNRNPEPDEVETCEPFLFQQIDVIQPKVIVALGAFAVRTLLCSDQAISRLRGQVFEFRGAKLVPTFHPAFLLRSPERKRDVWEDMQKVQTLLAQQ
ncbi:MAG: uracil-DNA glycosylase [Acidobacteriota bacterium]|nr:uracil-DNA glycosylase [Acidobacteriota bacterium]